MVKFVVAIMGGNHLDCLKLCVESVEGLADHILYLDGSSTDGSLEWAREKAQQLNLPEVVDNKAGKGKMHVELNYYDHADKGGNGKQRNIYLNYLKKYFLNDWCLVLDADELLDGAGDIKAAVQHLENEYQEKKCQGAVLSPRMRHFVWNFACEDATRQEHYVPNRFFKITEDLFYPESEHPVLTSKAFRQKEAMKMMGRLGGTMVIWHLAYALGVFAVRNRYKNHITKSEIHKPEFLEWWNHAHLFGGYPSKPIPDFEVPQVIKKNFYINDDFLYFNKRTVVEAKHFQMVAQWKKHFNLYGDSEVIDVGCGMGLYMQAWDLAGVGTVGLEMSDWAVKRQTSFSFGEVFQQDITKPLLRDFRGDLVTALDILEHLPYDKLDFAIENLKKLGSQFLTSIPYLGDPNLDADHTHIIRESKDWWVKKFAEHGIVMEDAPKDWLFGHQMLVGRTK